MQLLSSDDINMRVSVLWTLRNTLHTSDNSTKQTIMTHLGWPQLVMSVTFSCLLSICHHYDLFRRLCNDLSPEIQEQAMSILHNLTENEEGVDYVFESIDAETLANCITVGLESSNEDVTRRVILNLHSPATLANSTLSDSMLSGEHRKRFAGTTRLYLRASTHPPCHARLYD